MTVPRRIGLAAAVVLTGASACLSQGSEQLTLVENGKTKAALVLPKSADANEAQAAAEIVDYVARITGARIPIHEETPPAGAAPVIYVGRSLTPEALAKDRIRSEEPGSFVLRVTSRDVRLAGLTPLGTLFAAYELLEQLGVRWCMPGELGTVVPSSPTLQLATQDNYQSSPFDHRLLQGVPDTAWQQHLRGAGRSYGGHGIPIKVDRTQHPELFCEENGKPTQQLRVSNPEVLRLTVEAARAYFLANPTARYLNIAPADGAGFGSDPWDANDFDPNHGKLSVTDRYVKFFNLVLAAVQKEFPDAGIAFYAYGQCMLPPIREKPNPRILAVFAPIDVCRFHGVDNPICPERAATMKVIEGWQKLGCRVSYRGYFFNLADFGLPFSMLRQIGAEIPYFKQHGISGCRVQCMPMWGHHAPSLYLAMKLMWNPDANADAILGDYFEKFYGPAAKPAAAYFETMEDVFYRADYHTGNVFDMPHILTPSVMQRMDGLLKEAEGAVARDSLYGKRLAMVRFAHDYGQAGLDMINAFNAFRFADAKAAYDRTDALQRQGLQGDPTLISRDAGPYLKRFWSNTVHSAYAHTTGGNDEVARLPDEWSFLKDDRDAGLDLALFRPDAPTTDWKPLRTCSTSWGNQGLRYYKGVGWYRTTVAVDAKFHGRRIGLWLGGVDDQARAWVNGKELPLQEIGKDKAGNTLYAKGAAPIGRPWEFIATDAVEFGKSNVVVIRVTNFASNELGTGGLTAPAMLWAEKPAEPRQTDPSLRQNGTRP